MGNELPLSPISPAEIRAPAGTLAGVSGFQVHFASTDIPPRRYTQVPRGHESRGIETNLMD